MMVVDAARHYGVMRFSYFLILVFCFTSCKTRKKLEAIKASEKTVFEVKKIVDTLIVDKEESAKQTTTAHQKDTLDVFSKNKITPKTAKQLLALHELWDNLLQKHVSKKGNVNYKGLIKERKKLQDYIYTLDLALSNKAFQSFSNKEKLAFWINAYNAFTVDLILRNYPIKSIKDIKNPWKQRHWKLGDKWYDLDEIEHQILRKMNEPRIHFAINCASISCPKLQNKAFTASNLEIQLDLATKAFINNRSLNAISKETITISKLFQWFAKDFKKEGSLIDFLNQHSDIKISNQAKKSFMDYNWNLNE